MDERTAQIEHVIQHYLHRDLFRIYAREYVHRLRYRRNPYINEFGPVSHYKCNGDRIEDWVPQGSTIHLTREALKRSKDVTIAHLHDLLHAEPMLSIHEHVHSDGVIFTYVIQEAEF